LIRWLRVVAIALGVLIPVAVIGFFVGMRFTGSSPEQQAAIALMTAPTPPVQGHDASDAIWLMPYDVPGEKRPDLMRALRRYLAAAGSARGSSLPDPRRQLARFADEPKAGEGVCEPREPGCLSYVSDHRAEVGAALDANRGARDAALAIAAYDGFRLGIPYTLASEIPSLGTGRRLAVSDFAYRFASGERLTAVEAVCRDLSGWRRVGGNADNLVVSMVGAAWVRQDIMLLADMLAKLPKETELPADCGPALEASADFEYDLCPAMRSEFAAQRNARQQFEQLPEREIPPWLIDWRNFEAMIAQDMAPYCTPAVLAQVRADRIAASALPPAPRCSTWRRRADYLGCAMFEAAASNWSKYLDRRADQAQMLALLRTVVWLRVAADNPQEVASVLASRPDELGLSRRPAYDPEKDVIAIELHDKTRGARFEIAAGAEPRPTRARFRFRRSRAIVLAD
jgi:hypothetical protein